MQNTHTANAFPLILFSFSLFLMLSACGGSSHETETVTISAQEAREIAGQVRERVQISHMDEFDVSLWASDTLLADPVGLHMDDRGQAYVTRTTRRRSSMFDIRSYPQWMTESLRFQTVADRRDFLHRELSPERSEENSSWLPDRNEDGLHDWRDLTVEKEMIYRIGDPGREGVATVSETIIRDFHEVDSDIAGTVLYHDGEIVVGVAPDVWRFSDTAGDGRFNSKESISHGYGVHIGFGGHGMSGLRKGPDGRIYWSVGDIGLNVTDQDGKQWVYPNQGAIMRSEPDGSNFEVFAAGLRNTHEFDFDKYGNLISIDNDGDHAGEFERLVYLIDGSDSGWRINWQFGKYTDERNNNYKVWMDEDYYRPRFDDQAAHILPPLARYHSGPAGMVYNPGTALNSDWEDHFFVAAFTGTPPRSFINAFTLEPAGASFRLKSDQTVMEGVLATGLSFGPDGALYIADWVEGWQPNGEGRIWRLDTPGAAGSDIRRQTEKLLGDSFEKYPDDELLDLFRHRDMRVRSKAQFELVSRNQSDILIQAIRQTDHQLQRIHGLWGIGQLSRRDSSSAEPIAGLLDDPDSEIRAQSARLLGDIRYHPAAHLLVTLLEDKEPRVRFFALEALGRIGNEAALEPIVKLLVSNDDDDVYLRIAGAIALERIGDADFITTLSSHPSRAVRIAAVVALKRLDHPGVAVFLSDDDEYVVTNAARAINDDMFIEAAMPELAAVLEEKRFTSEPLLRRAINASLFNGTAEDAMRLARFATRRNISVDLRSEALAVLSVWEESSPLDRVTGRYRGGAENSPDDARLAVELVFNDLIRDENPEIQVSVARTAANTDYRDALPELLERLTSDASAHVRSASLESLAALDFEDPERAFSLALEDEDSDVRMRALEMIPGLDMPEESRASLLEAVFTEGDLDEKQIALQILGEITHESAHDVLEQQMRALMRDEISAYIHLDLTETVRNSGEERLTALLEQYNDSKPAGDPVAEYKESLYGGSAGRGERIFYEGAGAECVRCHAIAGQGGDAGPDLSEAGRDLSRTQILQSLVDPSARIAPGYGVVTLVLDDGETLRGIFQGETDTRIMITRNSESMEIDKSGISERLNAPSAMPDMSNILSRSELRDLVEFISTLESGK